MPVVSTKVHLRTFLKKVTAPVLAVFLILILIPRRQRRQKRNGRGMPSTLIFILLFVGRFLHGILFKLGLKLGFPLTV